MAMDRFSRKVHWDVNRSVCIASFFYLFYYGGKACLFPFISLYFRQMGLSASQTGLVFGLKSFLWFCVSPIWMALVYRVNKTKIILCYSIFIVIGTNLSLTLLPPADPKESFYVCLNESSPFQLSDSDLIENVSSVEFVTANRFIEETTGKTLLIEITSPGVTVQPYPTTAPPSPPPQAMTTIPITRTIEKTEAITSTTTTQSSASTTTSTPLTSTVSSTTEGPYQIAQRIAPKMRRKGITGTRDDDKDIIVKFVNSYEQTKDWPIWKKYRLIKRIEHLLSNSNEEEENRRQTRDTNISQNRDAINDTKTSLFDAVTSFNFTLLSEKKDAALKNLTETMRNFAEKIQPHLQTNTNLFMCVLIIMAAGELLSAPVELVSDYSLYNLLDELDSLNHYGKHRLMALIGAALCGISVSIVVYFSPCLINGTINRFHIHFYLFAMLLGISFILAPFFPSYDSASSSARSRVSGGAGRKCTSCSSTVCSSCRHFLLLITIFIVGITQAPVQNFMLWKIQDMEGSSELVYGSFVSVTALSAMISSLCGRRMMKVLKPWTVAFISLLSISIQLVMYALIPSPWLIVPLQLLNITGQSFLWTIVTHHTSTTMSSSYEDSKKISNVHVFARASQQRSLHTSYVSVYQGLSFSFGSVLSGFLYDYFQGDLTPVLIGSAILVASWGIFFAMYQCCCLPRKLRRKYSHLVSDSESDVNLAENNDFALKRAEKNGNYVSSYYSVSTGKKKRRNNRKKKFRLPIDSDSQSSADDEYDWLKSSMKKESRML